MMTKKGSRYIVRRMRLPRGTDKGGLFVAVKLCSKVKYDAYSYLYIHA